MKASTVYKCILFSLIQSVLTARQIPLHDSTSVISLQQTLALYVLGVDTKNYTIWDFVFSPNIIANYSAPFPILTGLSNVTAAISAGLVNVGTQHALSSFSVQELGVYNASTIQYFTATHFGKRIYEGQILVSYGKYVDEWRIEDGKWLIERRQLDYMGPFIGNTSIFNSQ